MKLYIWQELLEENKGKMDFCKCGKLKRNGLLGFPCIWHIVFRIGLLIIHLISFWNSTFNITNTTIQKKNHSPATCVMVPFSPKKIAFVLPIGLSLSSVWIEHGKDKEGRQGLNYKISHYSFVYKKPISLGKTYIYYCIQKKIPVIM